MSLLDHNPVIPTDGNTILWSIEEEIPMTMQIGMVGSDGVLIASDTEYTDNSVLIRRSWNETKIRINHNCGIAISMAGGMVTAGHLADGIFSLALEDENWVRGTSCLSRLSKSIDLAKDAKREAECIVICANPHPSLRCFRVARVGTGLEVIGSDELLTKVYAGDPKNSAVFWAERYFPKDHQMPIASLMPLAAHLIIAAGRVPNGGISGLEIVVCYKSGIHRLSDESISALRSQAINRDEDLGDSLLTSTQQFTYTPNVIG
jgi:hypothetical protein